GRAVDHRTDQFSLGLIVYEMCTGRPAFRRDSPAQVLAAVIERDPPPLGELRRDVPAELAALVSRCLQKDPAQRFATTAELAAQPTRRAGGSRAGARVEAPSTVTAVPTRHEPPAAGSTSSLYHVQHGHRIRRYDETKLAELIRRGKLSGMEMIRQDDADQW